MTPEVAAVEVLTGRYGDLSWSVLVSGDDEDLLTMIQVHRGSRCVVAGSGFAGPRLRAGEFLTEWRGRTDDCPYFVMTRSDPRVDRIVAVTDRGTEVQLAMSAVIPRFRLRFAAAALPDGEAPAWLRAESVGVTVADLYRAAPPVSW